jgi:transglutaminase-like putative cysteine protease
MLPEKHGEYRKVRCNSFAEVNPDKGNIFFDDNRAVLVLYSGIQKHAVTHTIYTLHHTDLHHLPQFLFQEELPVDKACYEVTVPKYVEMGFVLRGNDTDKVVRTVEEGKSTITYRFTVNNLKAMKEHDNVPSQLYYATQVIPYIKSYKMSESNKRVDMLANTDQLYKYMYKFVRNRNMKADTLLDATVAEITKNDVSATDKAKHIYQWVQKNLHYIAFEKGLEGFVPRDAAVVLKRKYGDCKDMTAVLVTMCQRAGLDAHYCWIGSRSRPYLWNETPVPQVADHMICALKHGGEWIFMDGTDPYIPFGQNTEMIQGKEALIAIDDNNYKIVTVPVTPLEKNVMVDSTLMTFAEKKITGTVKQYYKGYDAWTLGIMKKYAKGDDWKKLIRAKTMRGSDKYQYSKDDVVTGQTAEKDATITTEFAVDDYVTKAGKQYFINMNLKRTFADNRIDTEGRNVPYYFDHKQKTTEVVVLELPKGYKVSYLPPTAEGGVDGLCRYKVWYKADKKTVTLVKEYELTAMEASPKQFAANNKMVDDLKKLYKESVVLTAK